MRPYDEVIGKLTRRWIPDALIHHARWRRDRLSRPMPLTRWIGSWCRSWRDDPLVVAMEVDELRHPIHLRADTSDQYVYEQIFIQRQYDIDIMPPRTIIDAGANIGLASVLLASRYPDADVIAIEPDADNFRMLVRNTAPYRRVRCIAAAVWSHGTRVRRIADDAKPWAYRFDADDVAADGSAAEGSAADGSAAEGSAAGTRAIDMNQVIGALPGGRADLVKMDIEGAELTVFRDGDPAWLAHTRDLWIECHDRFLPGCEAAVRDRLPPDRYDQSVHGENLVFRRRDGNTQRSIAPS